MRPSRIGAASVMVLGLLSMRLEADTPPRAGRQEPAVPQAVLVPAPTKIEALFTSPDAVIERDLYRLGDATTVVSGLVIDAMVVTERASGRSLRGARFQLGDDTKAGQTATSYVDLEELPALSAALGQMNALALQWAMRDGARSVETQFTTVGGFGVRFDQSGQSQSAHLTCGTVDPAHHTVTIAELTTLKTLVDQSLALLGQV